MRICFDYEIFWREKFGSISSRYFFNLIKILSNNRNLNVKVFAKFYLNTKLQELSKKNIVGDRVKFKPPLTGRIFEKLNYFFLDHEIKKFQPEIIHKTYYSKNINKRNNSKIFLTVFDLWHEKNSYKNYKPKQHSIQISDHIFCPSIFTKNDLMKFYKVDEKKITVTYFGIEKFENIQTKENIYEHEKPFLLFVGARGRYKNFSNFISAFANSKTLSHNFNIKCFGGENFSTEEINLFKKLKISNCVFKEKNVDDQTLFILYKNAKCLVYPSAHEGFGLPPLEAMSLRCPVIASNHDAILEGVGNAAATFDPTNILEIQMILEKYLYSEEKLDNLKNLGILQSNKFSWNKCVEQTLDVYKKLLN